MVERIVWGESYSVGHSHMDTHHKNLVNIINRLVDLENKIQEAGGATIQHNMEYMKSLTSV